MRSGSDRLPAGDDLEAGAAVRTVEEEVAVESEYPPLAAFLGQGDEGRRIGGVHGPVGVLAYQAALRSTAARVRSTTSRRRVCTKVGSACCHFAPPALPSRYIAR